MILGILLAAGASRRMGRDKLGLPWRGGTVLSKTLENWTAVHDLAEVFLVRRSAEPVGLECLSQEGETGSVPADGMANEVAINGTRKVTKTGAPESARDDAGNGVLVRVLVNPDADEGMGASLRIAARAVPAEAEAVVVGLADMPGIASSTIRGLVAAWKPLGPRGIVAPTFEGRRGHPVVFGSAHFAALRELSGDSGARCILRDCAADLRLVPVDDSGVILDLDTPADLEARP